MEELPSPRHHHAAQKARAGVRLFGSKLRHDVTLNSWMTRQPCAPLRMNQGRLPRLCTPLLPLPAEGRKENKTCSILAHRHVSFSPGICFPAARSFACCFALFFVAQPCVTFIFCSPPAAVLWRGDNIFSTLLCGRTLWRREIAISYAVRPAFVVRITGGRRRRTGRRAKRKKKGPFRLALTINLSLYSLSPKTRRKTTPTTRGDGHIAPTYRTIEGRARAEGPVPVQFHVLWRRPFGTASPSTCAPCHHLPITRHAATPCARR